jgi:hypothetical protein
MKLSFILISYSRQFQYRRCLSLNSLFEDEMDSSTFYIKHLIRSQSLLGTTSDNEKSDS